MDSVLKIVLYDTKLLELFWKSSAVIADSLDVLGACTELDVYGAIVGFFLLSIMIRLQAPALLNSVVAADLYDIMILVVSLILFLVVLAVLNSVFAADLYDIIVLVASLIPFLVVLVDTHVLVYDAIVEAIEQDIKLQFVDIWLLVLQETERSGILQDFLVEIILLEVEMQQLLLEILGIIMLGRPELAAKSVLIVMLLVPSLCLLQVVLTSATRSLLVFNFVADFFDSDMSTGNVELEAIPDMDTITVLYPVVTTVVLDILLSTLVCSSYEVDTDIMPLLCFELVVVKYEMEQLCLQLPSNILTGSILLVLDVIDAPGPLAIALLMVAALLFDAIVESVSSLLIVTILE